MGRVISNNPENRIIEIRTCINRGGHEYTHPFIGNYAISRCLEHTLDNEFGIKCTDGAVIPDSFFEKYELIAVVPDFKDKNRKKYVTSDYWLTLGIKQSFILNNLPFKQIYIPGNTYQGTKRSVSASLNRK